MTTSGMPLLLFFDAGVFGGIGGGGGGGFLLIAPAPGALPVLRCPRNFAEVKNPDVEGVIAQGIEAPNEIGSLNTGFLGGNPGSLLCMACIAARTFPGFIEPLESFLSTFRD